MEAPRAGSIEGIMTDSPRFEPERDAELQEIGVYGSPKGLPAPMEDAGEMNNVGKHRRGPWGHSWRGSTWYITSVVTLSVTMDILTYSIVIPVLPYRLQALNYSNISALTSWLLFSYSAGIFVFTFPVAWYFHRHPWRREPLVAATLGLIAALVLFMLAMPYWAMVLARVIQGACSTVVWSVGFALLCENVDPKNVGRQLGFAFSGLSVGLTIAPPIGGALYSKLGWHAPFVFCIGLCAADLIARLLVLERKDFARWEAKHGQPVALTMVPADDAQSPITPIDKGRNVPAGTQKPSVLALRSEDAEAPATPTSIPTPNSATGLMHGTTVERSKDDELSPVGVLITLAKVPRGTVAFMLVFVFGLIMGGIDPTFTLHVEDVWHKDSDFVGLLYLAAAAPTFFVGPIAGALADKYGAETIVTPALILSLPWLPLMLINNLPMFAVMFAFANIFIGVLNSAASLEMAQVAHMTPGISEIHEFAALNVAFSLSSAIGAVAGGQIYDHVSKGWEAVVWFCFAWLVVAIPAPLVYTGARPLLWRMFRRQPKSGRTDAEENEGAQGNAVHDVQLTATGQQGLEVAV